MSAFKKFWRRFIDLTDDWFIYAVTIASVMFSSQMDALKSGGEIALNFSSGNFILSALVSLGIIAYQERLKKDETGTVDKSRAGRKAHFWGRIGKSISFGIMWPQILEFFIK